jgi:hypothetical protein
MKHIDPSIQFPLTLIWEDGSSQELVDISDIQCNLEDFDSSKSPQCILTDANGERIDLRVSMTWIERLERSKKRT